MLNHHHVRIQQKRVDQALPGHNPVLAGEWSELSSQTPVLDECYLIVQEHPQAIQVEFEYLVTQDLQCDANKMLAMGEHLGDQRRNGQRHQDTLSLIVGWS